MSPLVLACLVAAAVLGLLAGLAIAAVTVARRPSDRRATREWQAFQASLRDPRSRCRR